MKCNTVTKKVVLILSFGIVCLLVLGSISLGKDIPSETKETNYVGLVNLGLAPNTFMREPTPRDINTGVKFSYEDRVYTLYESREIKDIGKTFVWVN